MEADKEKLKLVVAACKGKSLDTMGGGGGAAAAPAAAEAAPAKEESEEDDDRGFGLFD